MNEPDKIIAGTTNKWNERWSSYPANGGWSLTYVFNGPTSLSISGTANGDSFDVTLTATQTGGMSAGGYAYQATVTKGSETYLVSSGSITVLASLAQVPAGTDLRSVNQQILDALEASMVGAASRDQLELSVNGRQVRYMSIAEKIKAINFFRNQVKQDKLAERVDNGSDTPGGGIHVRFNTW